MLYNLIESNTHRREMPAFLTADEIALMAVSSELSSVVSSPVASGKRLCSARTKLVKVTKSVCTPWLDILTKIVLKLQLQLEINRYEMDIKSRFPHMQVCVLAISHA